MCICVSVLCVSAREKTSEGTIVNVHQECLHFVCVCFMFGVCVCMYEFLICQYEMCGSHVEQDIRSLRPGPCLGNQPRVM